MLFIYRYRPKGSSTKRFIAIGRHGAITLDLARERVRELAGEIARGNDPAHRIAEQKTALTISALADLFMAEHILMKRKGNTATFYRHVIDRCIIPELGSKRVTDVTRTEIAKLHISLWDRRFLANRM